MAQTRYLVFHHPGPKWQAGVDFREQTGVMDHVQHYGKIHSDGLLEMGGPFPEGDRGGMMIFTPEATREKAEELAEADPAIASGLLTYEIVEWYVPMERA